MGEFNNAAGTAADGAATYVNNLLNLLGQRDPLAVLEETPALLRSIVTGRPAAMLELPEGPGKWSALQALQHVADVEVVYGWRLRMILGQTESQIQGFDQDLWATALRYEQASAEEALDQLATLRRANLRMVERFSRQELDARYGMHSERGRETAWRTLEMAAAHDLVHRRQILRALEAVDASGQLSTTGGKTTSS